MAPSDDEDSAMQDSLDSSPAPSTPVAQQRIEHLDLQSPPLSQHNTPFPSTMPVTSAAVETTTDINAAVEMNNGSMPSWMTKRSLDEQHTTMEKLLDRGFSSRNLESIFDESDMKL